MPGSEHANMKLFVNKDSAWVSVIIYSLTHNFLKYFEECY
jgi:hypothetical protein